LEHAIIVRLALYQPDIPQNLGAAIRLCACMGVPLDVIDPCGFPLTDKALRRSAMDYGDHAAVTRHESFAAFLSAPERRAGRLVLIETDGETDLYGFAFQPRDTLALGRETQGAGQDLRAASDSTVRIPMMPGLRSLNVGVAGAIALTEALRQTGQLPKAE
jgi:tRNA (cytidine/uridine-2'-O-)-methyltransferase